MIADYKVKKLMTEELMANADLDGISDNNQDYYQNQKFDDSGNESNEEDANAVMDQMIEQYKGAGAGAQQTKQRRPPAIV